MQKYWSGVLAYYYINMKSLFLDKISFLWSIALPLVMFVINQAYVTRETDLAYYWCYMIVSSFVFGLGIYAVEMRESGCLKTYFSINNSKWAYMIGNFLTQVTYTMICLFAFNFFLTFYMDFDFLHMTLYSSLIMLLCIPMAIGSYVVCLFRKLYSSTIKTLATIIIFFLLVIVNSDYGVNRINPVYFIPNIMQGNKIDLTVYVAWAFLSIVVGAIGIRCFHATSIERR